jgi:hypothetical protein
VEIEMETEIEMDMEAITAYQQVGSQRACPNAKTSFEWKKLEPSQGLLTIELSNLMLTC